ncbi:hypothetical protein LINPERHAP1_LOCUS22925 [Linum perenne]
MESVETNGHQLFFIDGYGGTGKKKFWQVISMKLRAEKKVALCVASSGIAALLMTGGRTAHSRFHTPIDVHSTSTCHIDQESELAKLLRHTSLIIWDEAPMSHKDCIHSFDRTLLGDFRQILPVIPKATRTEIINSSIKRSYLWDNMNVIALHQNMRLHREGCTREEAMEISSFSRWILDIGEGRCTMVFGESKVEILEDMLVDEGSSHIQDIVEATYGNLSENYCYPSYFSKRAILAPFHIVGK